MSFELSIKCTKDIDELHINFSDGSSSVVTKPKPDRSVKSEKAKPSTETPKETVDRSPGSHRGQILDLDADFGGVSQDVVKPPVIEDKERPANVADELQNLDI